MKSRSQSKRAVIGMAALSSMYTEEFHGSKCATRTGARSTVVLSSLGFGRPLGSSQTKQRLRTSHVRRGCHCRDNLLCRLCGFLRATAKTRLSPKTLPRERPFARWRQKQTFGLLPLDERILGIFEPLVQIAMEFAQDHQISPGLRIRAVTAVYFCATNSRHFGVEVKVIIYPATILKI